MLFLLLAACFAPLDGVYTLDTTAGWDGFCDTSSWEETDPGASNIAVDVAGNQQSMILTDAGGDYSCSLDGADFECPLFDDTTAVTRGVQVRSTLDMEGTWDSNTSFLGSFIVTLTCAEGDCPAYGYDDCTSVMEITGVLAD